MPDPPLNCFKGSLCCPGECNFDSLYATTCAMNGGLANGNVLVPENGLAFLDVGLYSFVYGEANTTGGLRNKDVTITIDIVTKTVDPNNHTVTYDLAINGIYDLAGTPTALRRRPLLESVTFNCNSYSRKRIATIDRDFVTDANVRQPFMDTTGFGLYVSNNPNAFPIMGSQIRTLGCEDTITLTWSPFRIITDTNTSAADIEFKMGYDPGTGNVNGWVADAGEYCHLEIETKASDDDYWIKCQYNSAYLTFDDDAPFAYSDNWDIGPTVKPDGYTVELESSIDRADRFMYVKWKFVDDVCIDPGPITDPQQVLFRLIMKSGAYDIYTDLIQLQAAP